jgi:hypothetical protein
LLNKERDHNVYSLYYTSSPGKSYVVEPEGGALNYDQAYNDPLAFYKKVLEQNITQHEAIDKNSPNKRDHQVTLTTKLTHRNVAILLLLV